MAGEMGLAVFAAEDLVGVEVGIVDEAHAVRDEGFRREIVVFRGNESEVLWPPGLLCYENSCPVWGMMNGFSMLLGDVRER